MHIPNATYRIQFNAGFTFPAAQKIIPYLSALGVTDIYASPVFKARKGSLHGYDVVDPNEINPELGGKDAFDALIASVHEQGLYWLQDIVPNHMAFDSQNSMLMDVLANGSGSAYFQVFDIDWEHPSEDFRGRLLIPFLGSFYAQALENKEIQISYTKEGLFVTYYEFAFPIKLSSYNEVFRHDINKLEDSLSADDPDYIKYLGALHLLDASSEPEEPAPYDQRQHIIRILWELYEANDKIRAFLDSNITFFNGVKGSPHSFDALDSLLQKQPYRLAFWKVASEEINYRRFFSINDLISVRVENEQVFELTHDLIRCLVAEKKFDGLRVDHIDGLYDPSRYLDSLRKIAPDAYIVVEKILARREPLCAHWPIQGTTGYDFMNIVNSLFCERHKERELEKLYRKLTGWNGRFDKLATGQKRLVIGKHMAGDVDNLAQFIKTISSRDRYGRDITLYALKRALVEVMASFGVYRTYVNHYTFREVDRKYIIDAITRARSSNPGLIHEYDFIEKFLLFKYPDSLSEEEKQQWRYFVMKFQQYTGPLMAKGFEDTALYVYNRFISLNEVGGAPDSFGCSLEEFSVYNRERYESFPHSMNAATTHDTKRGEDVRARLNVLSELCHEWSECVRKWVRINKRKKELAEETIMPDANDEYFLYQTLIGAYPADEASHDDYTVRIKEYMIKAIREAKVHTAWIKPDSEYENACLRFIEKILTRDDKNEFFKSFRRFGKKVAFYGVWNSLSQVLLKMTCPGVPDFYQGSELWDLSLVDPDNRRPVDFEKRKGYLDDIHKRAHNNVDALIDDLLVYTEDGRVKLFLIYRILDARKKYEVLFREGAFVPLEVNGLKREHCIAFARTHSGQWAIVLAPRFVTGLVEEGQLPRGEPVWKDTSIELPLDAPRHFLEVITGRSLECAGRIAVSKLCSRFPAAVLISTER